MKRKIVISILLSMVFLGNIVLNISAVSLGGISAKAYVLLEAQTGKVIASKDEHKMLPMASTTKIMTTLLMLESGGLDDEFMVDNEAIKVEGSSMGLCENDIVTKRALCYGMMLPSGNDAANQTAVMLAENTDNFAVMMNERASEIGMKNTNFVTPSGLHDDNHYSTAYDMALLAREAMKNDLFREICGTQRAKIRFGNPPYERWLVNTNKLLHLYDYCIGVKTGFTDEAGRCLVSAAEKDGVTLICVTLNAPNDWNDHIKLYDYGFSVAEIQPIEYDFSKLSVPVAGGTKNNVAVTPTETPVCVEINGEKSKVTAEVIMEKFLYAPVSEGKKAGQVNFYSDDKLIFSAELIASEECEAMKYEYKTSLLEKIVEFIKSFL
ncbi:MAG: D-alanyl-D-alanine carboxypeptidase [Ruminococcus sp.]|nr:D-alanyl-D-alanine carboxypeptidase [Ruminococcus sp.]